MSQVSEMILQLQADAHEMGDDFGFETATVELLAKQYNLPVAFVQQALDMQEEDEEMLDIWAS